MGTAGIDFGSTLVKAYWRADGHEHYATADDSAAVDELARMMRLDGVRKLRVTGIGGAKACSRLMERFPVVRSAEGAVDDEIRLQAAGTRLLMGNAPRKMLIASVGTGVSYTKVKGRKAKRSPLGSAHGGGTILGLGRFISASSFQELEEGAAAGTPADLLVKHQLPATAGTPLGELVIAHFWGETRCYEDRCASILSFAASSIVKDFAVLTSIPFSPKDIVVIGGVSASPTFRRYLEKGVDLLKKMAPSLKKCRLHFPERGEYAAAVGAWADIST